jgi:hypothetical protein
LIYLQQDFDLHPATPRTRDAFVALAQDALAPTCERHGARQMADFTKMLADVGPHLPILASWRPVAGNQDLVIDLWKGDVEQTFARCARANAFMDPLREVAPNERIVRCFPLPYSPLL